MKGRIGLDTNVALRWLVEDRGSPLQSQIAVEAMAEQAEVVHINLVVLSELIWLGSQVLKMDRAQQTALLRGLLDHPSVDLANRASVESAFAAFEAGGAGFTDHLIGALNADAGCKTTLTFDQRAARSPHFTALGS